MPAQHTVERALRAEQIDDADAGQHGRHAQGSKGQYRANPASRHTAVGGCVRRQKGQRHGEYGAHGCHEQRMPQCGGQARFLKAGKKMRRPRKRAVLIPHAAREERIRGIYEEYIQRAKQRRPAQVGRSGTAQRRKNIHSPPPAALVSPNISLSSRHTRRASFGRRTATRSRSAKPPASFGGRSA